MLQKASPAACFAYLWAVDGVHIPALQRHRARQAGASSQRTPEPIHP